LLEGLFDENTVIREGLRFQQPTVGPRAPGQLGAKMLFRDERTGARSANGTTVCKGTKP
jgi:hypothetical protein